MRFARSLQQVKRDWPRIRERLDEKLMPRAEVRELLQAAGCPVKSEDIGISPERLRVSFRKAYHIRRRFTMLDLVCRANLWDRCLDRGLQRQGELSMSADPAAVDPPFDAAAAAIQPAVATDPGWSAIATADFAYWQWRILISTLVGYALFYFVRKNI